MPTDCSQFGVTFADNNYIKTILKLYQFWNRPSIADRIVKELRAGRSGVRIPALAVGGLCLVWSTVCVDGQFSDEVVLGKHRCRWLLSGNQNYYVQIFRTVLSRVFYVWV